MMCVAAAYMHEVHTIMFVAAVSLQYDVLAAVPLLYNVWLLYPCNTYNVTHFDQPGITVGKAHMP